MRLLVDGTNVMGSRPDGWWRDRPGAARRLVVQVVAMRRAAGQAISECTVVFDGRRLSDLPDGAGFGGGGSGDVGSAPGSHLAAPDSPGSDVAGADAAGSDAPGSAAAGSLVDVLWARRRGPDGADDRIIEWLTAAPDPKGVTVVTSDRRLAARARTIGAGVVGAGWLLDRLSDGISPAP